MSLSANNKVGHSYSIRKLVTEDIDQSFKLQWLDLIERAVEPFAYLDPNYVLSAIEGLSKRKLIIRAVYRHDTEKPILVGLGMFWIIYGDLRLPFPHLYAYKTEHSFLSGLVVDNQDTTTIITQLIDSLAKEYWYLAGVRFADFPVDDGLGQQLTSLTGSQWFQFWDFQRATYMLPKQADGSWSKDISRKRLKNYRKAKRELEMLGILKWRLLRADEITQSTVDDFLRVEHSGWKGEAGTSILSDSDHVRFFNSLVNRFKKNDRIFFTELRLNDKVVAGTSNLICKGKAFAFKVGWDIEYKKYSPGIVNEIEFLKYADLEKCDFWVIESGATENSFINHYWKGRWLLAEGVLSIHWFSKTLNSLNNSARILVKKLLKIIKGKDDQIL